MRRFNSSEFSRRRVYIDLDRPRPFYRRSQSLNDESRAQINDVKIKRQPQSLQVKKTFKKEMNCFVINYLFQEIIRCQLVKSFGLPKFRQCLKEVCHLPLVVKDQMLTFLCQDFEEILNTSGNKEAI